MHANVITPTYDNIETPPMIIAHKGNIEFGFNMNNKIRTMGAGNSKRRLIAWDGLSMRID